MESDNNIIKSLKDNIIKLRQLNESFKSSDEELPKEEQESILLQKLVDNFDLILSNIFKINILQIFQNRFNIKFIFS